MNEKRIRTARLIRLGLFIAVWFSVLYMFRWEIGTPVTYDQGFGDGKESIGYVKLHRWTGTSWHCRVDFSQMTTALCLSLPLDSTVGN